MDPSDRSLPEGWWEKTDREMIEEHRAMKAREAAGEVIRTYPGARVHAMILELNRRFEEAGRADPAIVQEVLERMKREVDGGA